MTLDMWLLIGAIGLPFIGALILWRWEAIFLNIEHWLVVLIFGIVGLVALAIFLLNGYFACFLVTGQENCLFDGLASLFIFLLNLTLARQAFVLESSNKRDDYILMLLLSGSCAGIGLSKNPLVIVVSSTLLLWVIYIWLRRRGWRWQSPVFHRDEHRDVPENYDDYKK